VLAISCLVVYYENSSDAFRRLWRRGNPPAKFRTEILNLKTAKEPDKNIGSNRILILGKENF